MPTIYLSPSTQEFNNYVDGSGSEEYYMNLIADAMIPYLDASGIGYVRNTKDMTAASSIAASNSGNYDFHLALHSNAAGEANSGKVRGTEVYYYPRSNNGQRAAEIIANNMKLIYPLPELVRTVPTETLGEVVRTKAPSVLIEYAYHDNLEDALWIENNIEEIARNTVLSLTDYFDIPFNYPQNTFMGTIVTPLGGSLNIRKSPSFNAPVIGSVPSGQNVTILASLPDWYLIRYNNTIGYSYAPYVK
ncbi:MAG: peptidoglycan hydrolase [Ruminococcaceae bacterium]|nr:peptidoglycan hydrolase [Oscillospiraceae bacterium]